MKLLTCECQCGDCMEIKLTDVDCLCVNEGKVEPKGGKMPITSKISNVIPAEIEIDGVKYTVTNPSVPPPQVGDFVKTTRSSLPYFVNNEYGKVIEITGGLFGVEFPRHRSGRHTCDDTTRSGHGWYLASDMFVKVD